MKLTLGPVLFSCRTSKALAGCPGEAPGHVAAPDLGAGSSSGCPEKNQKAEVSTGFFSWL